MKSFKTTAITFFTATTLSLNFIPQAQAIKSVEKTQNFVNNSELTSTMPIKNQQIVAAKFKAPKKIVKPIIKYFWKKHQNNKNK